MPACPKCAAAVDGPIGFHDDCPSCHAYLHCCVNCRLYSPHAHNHCLSSTTEYVRDVETANFCEEFDPATKKKDAVPPSTKSKFDQLFGK
jgi:hypothetical protein